MWRHLRAPAASTHHPSLKASAGLGPEGPSMDMPRHTAKSLALCNPSVPQEARHLSTLAEVVQTYRQVETDTHVHVAPAPRAEAAMSRTHRDPPHLLLSSKSAH